MKNSKRLIYAQAFSNEWFSIKSEGQVIECCDCCLVHKVSIRIRKGRVMRRQVAGMPATASSAVDREQTC